MAYQTLPLQATGTGLPWSIQRDTEFGQQLQAGLDAALGRGIVSGGAVAKTAALSVEVAAGTVFFAYGVALTLSVAAAATVAGSSPITLWGRIRRTAADYSDPTELDTYDLQLTHNSTDEQPDADANWFRIARLTVVGGEITAIETPPDAWVRAAALGNLSHVADGVTAYVPAGYQHIVNSRMTVEGRLVVRGRLIVRDL